MSGYIQNWIELDPNSRITTAGTKITFTNLQRDVYANARAVLDFFPITPLIFEFVYKYTGGTSGTHEVFIADGGNYPNVYSAGEAIGLRIDNPAGNGLYFISKHSGVYKLDMIHIFTAATILKTMYVTIEITNPNLATVKIWFDNPGKTGTPDLTMTRTVTIPSGNMTYVYGISGQLESGGAWSSSGWVDNVIVNPKTTPNFGNEGIFYNPVNLEDCIYYL